MRFARDHKRGKTAYRKGDPFVGTVKVARFLFHRGILEPDGNPMDALVTGPKVTKQVWDAFDAPEEQE